MQWRGDPVALVERFVAAGCVQPGQISLRDLMTTLHASASVDELPLLPSVWDGRHEDLRLACPAIAGRRFVLRLWESGHTDPEDGRRLWLGAAGFVEAVHTGAGFSHVTGVADDGTATDVFIRHAGTLVLARVQRETGVERILAGE